MQTTSSERYFLFALLAIALILTIAIFYPFLTVIILSAAFAVVLSPVYRFIKHKVTKGISWLASLITIIFFLIVLCGPLFFIGTAVFNQTQDAYQFIIQNSDSSTFIERIDTSINNAMPNGFTFDTEAKVRDFITFLTNNITTFFTSTLSTIIMFTLMILTIFYFLKDGNHWKKNIVALIPVSNENMDEIFANLKSSINRILKGSFLVGIIQGILVGIGLLIFGVPNPALWGVLAGMASFIPTIGTSLITIPAVLFLLLTGNEIQAIGLLAWSLVLVGLIDNLLSPYFISKNTNIPSVFILFSILGGLSLIGPVGILIGPLILSLLYSLVAIYKKDLKD